MIFFFLNRSIDFPKHTSLKLLTCLNFEACVPLLALTTHRTCRLH